MSDIEVVEVETVTPKSTRATARHHTFLIDKPAPSGGRDQGPMASEYFLASLGSCHITTAHKVAEKRHQKIDRIHVRGALHLNGDLIEKIELDIKVHATMSREEVETVFRLTERICTISRATSVPIVRRIELVA